METARRSHRPARSENLFARTAAVIAVCVAFVGSPLSAQSPSSNGGFWLGAGVGVGALGSKAAISLLGEVAHHSGSRVLAARTSVVAEILDDGAWEVAGLYGRVRRRSDGSVKVVVEAGPGMTAVCDLRGSILTGGACDYRYALGIAGGASVTFLTGSLGSLGLDAFVNVNHIRPFGGVVLALRIGKVR